MVGQLCQGVRLMQCDPQQLCAGMCWHSVWALLHGEAWPFRVEEVVTAHGLGTAGPCVHYA
jgi:hypothetical protein